tara:strand:+ start:5063 stop:5488 length:426 start_codon:yes stop_codon:yes gene_type:complete
MSEDTINVRDGFDPTKLIENLSLSTTYIGGLEQILIKYVVEMDNPADSKRIFKKFEDYVEGKLDISSDPFTEHESNLYTIFSLSQYLKAKAYEQGLNVELNATVKREDIVNVMDAVLKGDISKVQELNNKMQEDIKNQLPS